MREHARPARRRMILQLTCAAVLAASIAGGGWGIRQASAAWTRSKALERGNELLNTGWYAEAVLALSDAIRLKSKPARAHELRAIAYSKLGDNRRAVADLSTVISLDPGSVAAYQMRAASFLNLSEPGLAAQDLETALRLSPQWVLGYALRGRAYREQGKLKAALEDFDMAAALDPSAENYYQRGLTKEVLADYLRAIDDYTLALEIEPNWEPAYRARARAHAALGDVNSAAGDLRRAAECVKTEPTP
jgi:tetratricopeptide (TPR) repeat protein